MGRIFGLRRAEVHVDLGHDVFDLPTVSILAGIGIERLRLCVHSRGSLFLGPEIGVAGKLFFEFGRESLVYIVGHRLLRSCSVIHSLLWIIPHRCWSGRRIGARIEHPHQLLFEVDLEILVRTRRRLDARVESHYPRQLGKRIVVGEVLVPRGF